LVEAQRLLFHASNMEKNVEQLTGGVRGELRIGIGPASASAFIANLLEVLARHYPELTVQVVIAAANEMQDQLLEGRLDFFLARVGSQQSFDHRVVATLLGLTEPALHVRPGHPLAEEPAVDLEQLTRFPKLSGTAWNEVLRETPRRDFDALRATIELDNYEILADLVLRTDGILIAAFSDFGRGLVMLPVDLARYSIRPSSVSIFTVDGRSLSPAANRAVRTLERLYGEASTTPRNLSDQEV
jgi:DNA-binding transcriptional LysR family regulator